MIVTQQEGGGSSRGRIILRGSIYLFSSPSAAVRFTYKGHEGDLWPVVSTTLPPRMRNKVVRTASIHKAG